MCFPPYLQQQQLYGIVFHAATWKETPRQSLLYRPAHF